MDQTIAEEKQEFAGDEDFVNEVLRSLEEEIARTCSTSYSFCNSGDNSAVSDISGSHEVQILDSDLGIDLCYPLEASDKGLLENTNVNYIGENWHFEDDFENYQQFALY